MGVDPKMSAFQYIDSEALKNSFKMVDLIPASITAIIAIISIVYLKLTNRPRKTTENGSENCSENGSENVSKNIPKHVSENISENISKNGLENISKNLSNNISKTLSKNVLETISTNNTNTETKLNAFEQNLANYQNQLDKITLKMKDINHTLTDQKIEINNINRFMTDVNQEIENIYQAGSLSDISLKIDLDDTKQEVFGKLEKTVEDFEKKNVKLQGQIKQVGVDIDERLDADSSLKEYYGAFSSSVSLLG